jgi:hypothetical protein
MRRLKAADQAKRPPIFRLRKVMEAIEGFVIFLAAFLTILSLLGVPISLRYLFDLVRRH